MGRGIVCKCKQCGERQSFSFGVGFLFPKVYVETFKAMQEGKYGAFGKKFLAEHPDGAINCDNVVLNCTRCHKLLRDRDLTMYLPKKSYSEKPQDEIWTVGMSFRGTRYVAPWDLEGSYVEYAKFEHRCPQCQEQMEILDAEAFSEKLSNGELRCQKCGGELAGDGWLNWD